MSEWKTIESAPRDGTWFMICRADEGFDSYEVGRFEPLMWDDYELIEGTTNYRKVTRPIHEWRGFNNMHRATHWQHLSPPPVTA